MWNFEREGERERERERRPQRYPKARGVERQKQEEMKGRAQSAVRLGPDR